MKNFMKKTAFAALAALMALSAVSCGKTADGDGAETTAAQSGAAKAEPIVVQTNAYLLRLSILRATTLSVSISTS